MVLALVINRLKFMKQRPLLIASLSLVAILAVVTVGQAVSSGINHNNLKLFGRAFNPDGYFTIDDNAVIDGELNAKGNISDSNGNLTLDDTAAITGDLIVEGGAAIKGELYNPDDIMTINDNVTITGSLSFNSVPTPTTATCTTDGTISYDTTYLYLCVSGNWKKVALQAL